MTPTLRARINTLVCVTLLSIGVLLALGIYGYSQFRIKSLYEKERERLSASLNSQTNAVLMTYLIPEQRAGLSLLLSKFTAEESLIRANVMDHAPSGFPDCAETNTPASCLSSNGNTIGILAPIQEGSTRYAYLFKESRLNDTTQTTAALMIISVMAALLLAFLILFFQIARITSVIIPGSLCEIVGWLKNVLAGKNAKDFPAVPYSELGDLVVQMNEIVEQHHEKKLENERLQNEQTKFKLAQQVAHDIRSPLAALDVVVNQTNDLSEENRLLIRHAVQRIRDIANDLSKKKQDPVRQDGTSAGNEMMSVQLLSGLIDTLISEKRLQYRNRLGIEIESSLDESSYGSFAAIQPVEFNRVLSNLINNAVEALGDKGRVEVKLTESEKVEIQISDSGKGIPPEILPKLMQRGETHGKAGGSGLGLYHARTSVEKWGGSVEIDSAVDKGTVITIALPKSEAPSWFVEKINWAQNSLIVVIDDDASIHQIWKQRFENDAKNGAVKMIHFSSPDEIMSWHRKESPQGDVLYLCDYEFLNHDKTGLDVIRELNIAKSAILVTSRFEEDRVRSGCESLNIRMIPKNLAGFVPIHHEPKLERVIQEAQALSVDAVLIDDDDLVHMNWKMAAKRQNKILRVYAGPEEFWKEAATLPKDTPIYVDSNLSGGDKGEDVAWMMGKKGFSNLHLATGYEAAQFDEMPWLKGIVGKNPPWA